MQHEQTMSYFFLSFHKCAVSKLTKNSSSLNVRKPSFRYVNPTTLHIAWMKRAVVFFYFCQSIALSFSVFLSLSLSFNLLRHSGANCHWCLLLLQYEHIYREKHQTKVHRVVWKSLAVLCLSSNEVNLVKEKSYRSIKSWV